MTNCPLTLLDIKRLALVPPHHQILNQRALEVASDEVDTEIVQAMVDRMLDVARGETLEASGVRLVGLAAPQIGLNKRIIVIDTLYTGADVQNERSILQPFINPQIVERSQETELRREGCHSTGNVRGLVERATRITIEALDREGKPVLSNFEGFTARVCQHEIDHLDGIRFPDRITNDAHLHWVDPKTHMPAYRKNAEGWTCLCSRERWEALRLGKSFNQTGGTL